MKRVSILCVALGLLVAWGAGCCPPAREEAPPPKSAPKPEPKPMPAKTSPECAVSAAKVQKMGPTEVVVGQQFTYDTRVTNAAKVPLMDVEVLEILPKGFRAVASDPEGKAQGQNLKWTWGTLKAGESRTFKVTAVAEQTGRFEPCTQVTYRPCVQCMVIRAVKPELAVTKTGPAEVLICEPIRYEVTVQNTGTGPAKNVTFTDTLPAGLKAEGGGKALTSDIGTLDSGEAKKIAYTVMATKTGRFTNTAVATGDGDLKARATHTVSVKQPVLKVTKKGPSMRYIGREATFDITVTNSGDGEARNLMLTDMVPRGTSFAGATEGGKMAAGKVTWALGTLAPGAKKSVSVTLRADAKGTFTNTVKATALCAEATADATLEVKGISAILLEVIDIEDPIEVGANETYEITVTNQGSAVGTNIKIVCTLPAEQDYVSTKGPVQATVEGKTVTFAPLAELAPKAKAVYHVVTKGTKPGDVRFAVELTSDQMTTPANETESTHIYE